MCQDGYTFPPCKEERNKPGLHLSMLSFRIGPWSESNPKEYCIFIWEVNSFTSNECFEINTCNRDNQGSREWELTRELS